MEDKGISPLNHKGRESKIMDAHVRKGFGAAIRRDRISLNLPDRRFEKPLQTSSKPGPTDAFHRGVVDFRPDGISTLDPAGEGVNQEVPIDIPVAHDAMPALRPERFGKNIHKRRFKGETLRIPHQFLRCRHAVDPAEGNICPDQNEEKARHTDKTRSQDGDQPENKRSGQESRQDGIDNENNPQLGAPVGERPQKHHPERIDEVEEHVDRGAQKNHAVERRKAYPWPKTLEKNGQNRRPQGEHEKRMPERPPKEDGGRLAREVNEGIDIGKVGRQRQDDGRFGPYPLSEGRVRNPDADEGMRDGVHAPIVTQPSGISLPSAFLVCYVDDIGVR